MKKGEWIAVARHIVYCYVSECGCATPAIKELLNFMSVKDLKKEFDFQDWEIEEALKDEEIKENEINICNTCRLNNQCPLEHKPNLKCPYDDYE